MAALLLRLPRSDIDEAQEDRTHRGDSNLWRGRISAAATRQAPEEEQWQRERGVSPRPRQSASYFTAAAVFKTCR